ncbi:MAG: TMEM165/GDT1 family protein [Spongiibacteraceae bacterium]|jgi:putative Ca2+/H+ antiporter (TMEM165/GDT1 family)|nr:TMEM165/GDT1 family protein [Spongiibacteraceae bacterium]
MEALIASTLAVALAEIGDKTQLLSLFLAARFANRWGILAGITVATLINHGLSAWLGAWAAGWMPDGVMKWVVALSFMAIAVWVLIPDRDSEGESPMLRYGAFLAATVLFFIAEIGDKTQVATVVLAARFDAAVEMVIIGTTLGMLIANAPVVWAGAWLMSRLPLHWTRRAAFVLFLLFGVAALVAW